ncbi:methyltransferase-like protein 22 isoform X2 [Mytilus californianus]|uniref:methyltransferase-like protein 22 isoform X2 n=1 Tax=Mytilus californianus TaxID=6549 RepID=UPI002247387D|nr:methyltransferase-like protein 22 isoform X2 [Mytilus californianus]
MQKDELVLSDVHLQVQSNQSKGHNISRFYFSEDRNTKKKKLVSAKTSEDGKLHRSNFVSDSLTDIRQGLDKLIEITTKDGTECGEKTEDKGNPEMDRDKNIGGIEKYKDDKGIGEVKKDKDFCEMKTDKDVCEMKTDKDVCEMKTDKDVCEMKTDKDVCEMKTDKDVCEMKTDKDGDVEVKRRKRKIEDLSVITIAHKMETTLENVGQQIWLASLLMADFIISHKEEFQGKRILDLGAGVGLTSVVAAMYADHIISTEIGKDIKELAQHNLDQNNIKEVANYSVGEFDWFENKYSAEKIDEVKLKMDHEVENDIDSCDIAISADVIYDNNITDALFRTVYGLMVNTSISTWYISTEKRYVFTLQDLDIACPAYQHFRQCLTQLQDMSDHAQFTISCEEEFPQCFQYNRTKELELWKVTIHRNGTTK